MALVSICIPTYNYARFVDRAIESALAQTHRDIEVVVIDDASTDHTAEVVARFQSDERLSFIRNEHNIGLFANFNRCFELARGEFVNVLCADDWLHPRAVEDALALLEGNDRAAMSAAPGWLVDEQGRTTALRRAPFGDSARMVTGLEAIRAHADWGDAAGMPSQVLLRSSAIEEVGGFEAEFAPASDVHLWLKLLARHDLAWVAEPRSWLRVHGGHHHGYEHVPSESVFRLWKDMARREPAAVDQPMLARALRREAHHHLLYVAALLLRLRVASAAGLLRAIRANLPLGRALGSFVLTIPRVAWEQGLRMFARATSRLVVYDPAPRPGPRLSELADRRD